MVTWLTWPSLVLDYSGSLRCSHLPSLFVNFLIKISHGVDHVPLQLPLPSLSPTTPFSTSGFVMNLTTSRFFGLPGCLGYSLCRVRQNLSRLYGFFPAYRSFAQDYTHTLSIPCLTAGIGLAAVSVFIPPVDGGPLVVDRSSCPRSLWVGSRTYTSSAGFGFTIVISYISPAPILALPYHQLCHYPSFTSA